MCKEKCESHIQQISIAEHVCYNFFFPKSSAVKVLAHIAMPTLFTMYSIRKKNTLSPSFKGYMSQLKSKINSHLCLSLDTAVARNRETLSNFFSFTFVFVFGSTTRSSSKTEKVDWYAGTPFMVKMGENGQMGKVNK